MSGTCVELWWELVTGEGVVRVSADAVDGATRWGVHELADHELDERAALDDALRGAELF